MGKKEAKEKKDEKLGGERQVSVRRPKESGQTFVSAEKKVKSFFSSQTRDPPKSIREAAGDRYMCVMNPQIKMIENVEKFSELWKCKK